MLRVVMVIAAASMFLGCTMKFEASILKQLDRPAEAMVVKSGGEK